MYKIILYSAVIVLIFVAIILVNMRYSKVKKLKQTAINQVDLPLFNYIKSLLENYSLTDEETINLFSYESFRDICIYGIKNKVSEKISQEGYDWLKLSEDKLKIITKDDILSLTESALKSEQFDAIMANRFFDIVKDSVNEMEKEENNAIKYNSEFSKDPDGDPELHPRESNIDHSGDDDIDEISLEDLSSTGTIEDVDEDI